MLARLTIRAENSKTRERETSEKREKTHLGLGVGLARRLVEGAPLGVGALGERPLLRGLLCGGGLDLGGLLCVCLLGSEKARKSGIRKRGSEFCFPLEVLSTSF